MHTTGKIAALITAVVMGGGIAAHADARNKRKTHYDPKIWNPYNCCHSMTGAPGDPAVITDIYTVPEFYRYDTFYVADTSFVYKCYDSRDSLMDDDTVKDFAAVRYISLFKNYTDHAHTYTDKDGKKKPLPITNIVERMDRMGAANWMKIKYPGGKFSTLTEQRDQIVRIDTFVEKYEHPNVTVVSVYNYYKVSTKAR